MSSVTGHTVGEAARARELFAQAQQALWGTMYYVRNADIGITEAQVKRAIQCVEKLQARVTDALADESRLTPGGEM
jgi:hypothetical protein